MIEDQDENYLSRFQAYKDHHINQSKDMLQNQLKNLYFRKEESFQSEKSIINQDEVIEQQYQFNQNSSMIGETIDLASGSKNNLFSQDKQQNSSQQQEIQVELPDQKNDAKQNYKKDFLVRSSPNIHNNANALKSPSNIFPNSKILQQETQISNQKTFYLNQINTNQTKNSIIKQDINKITKIRSKLLNFFMKKTVSGRSNYLKNSKVRNALNDQSDLRDIKRSNFINNLEILLIKFQKQKKKCFQMIPLFNPQNPILFYYQIICNVLNICFFTFLSILLVFEGQLDSLQQILRITAFVWAVNVLIKLNTSIYIGTDIVINREKIIACYLKKNALNDLLPFISLILIQSSKSINLYLAVVSFLKIRNVYEENEDIQRQLCIAAKKYVGIQLTNLVFKLFMIAHIIACMWQLVWMFEINYLNQDINSPSFIIAENRSWLILYLESLYWSLTLMATGSNLANTPISICFTCLNMLVTTIIFGYLINVIGVMLSAIDEQQQMQRRDINVINDYMRKRCISKKFIKEKTQSEFKKNFLTNQKKKFYLSSLYFFFHLNCLFFNRNLQRRVNIDLEYFYQKNYKKISEENEQVLAKISTHLNEQIHREYYGRILDKISYISKYFSDQTLNKILDCIEELYYLPNQIIFREDQNSDFSLMYIAEGSVELSRQVSTESQISKTLAVLGQECVFGQHSFFTGHVRGACAKSKAFTTIIKISRDKFLNVIKQNEKDYEQFCQIKDDIMIYKNYEKIQVKCFVCNKFNHYSSDCPLTHFDREEFYGNMCYYQKIQQIRKYHERHKKKKTNSYMIFHQVMDAQSQMIQIEFKDDLGDEDKKKEHAITEIDIEEDDETESQPKNKNNQRNSIQILSINEIQDSPEHRKSQKFFSKGVTKLNDFGKEDNGHNNEGLEIQRSSFNNIFESNNYQGQEMKASAINKGSIKRIEMTEKDVDKRNNAQFQKLYYESHFKQDFFVYFDKAKEYQIYYPNGNFKILISKYNRVMKRCQKQKKSHKKN